MNRRNLLLGLATLPGLAFLKPEKKRHTRLLNPEGLERWGKYQRYKELRREREIQLHQDIAWRFTADHFTVTEQEITL